MSMVSKNEFLKRLEETVSGKRPSELEADLVAVLDTLPSDCHDWVDCSIRGTSNALGVVSGTRNDKAAKVLLDHGADPNGRLGQIMQWDPPLVHGVVGRNTSACTDLLVAGASIRQAIQHYPALVSDPGNQHVLQVSLAQMIEGNMKQCPGLLASKDESGRASRFIDVLGLHVSDAPVDVLAYLLVRSLSDLPVVTVLLDLAQSTHPGVLAWRKATETSHSLLHDMLLVSPKTRATSTAWTDKDRHGHALWYSYRLVRTVDAGKLASVWTLLRALRISCGSVVHCIAALPEHPMDEVRRHVPPLGAGAVGRAVRRAQRIRRLHDLRHCADAKRDAGLVFQAAKEGRPMELAKRLRLGVLAGGLEMKGEVEDGAGGTRVMGPLEAARLGGHNECVKVLEESEKTSSVRRADARARVLKIRGVEEKAAEEVRYHSEHARDRLDQPMPR